MSEFTYSNLTLEILDKALKDLMNIPPKRTWTVYMNGKMVKETWPHLENIDEHCTYLVEIPLPDFKVKKKKRKKRKR